MRRLIVKNRSHNVLLIAFHLILLLWLPAKAQRPFYTDDADVTPKGHFHVDITNEFDWLQRSSFPNLQQNTLDFELDFGLAKNLEVSVEAPLLTIFNAPGEILRRPSGIGDTNLAAKYNFHQERDGSRLPAMTIALDVELPTGNTARQLGSGLADVFLNGILQKSLNHKTKLRLNGGILFSGNETTGVIGIKTRGTVLTGGASLIREVSPKFQLGFEFYGALNKTLELGKGQLQTLAGGNYQFKKNAAFNFGVLGGKFAASPRFGIQAGVSFDF